MFSLRVFDAEYVSGPSFVRVFVEDVNRSPEPPTVNGPLAAVERSPFTLTATAVDPDGDDIV
ncbi:MAG: hypothetical protein HC923_12920, partial [Myxococcales bacterium]|nr:hypothetical protein [Myxococcales bacterium]